MSNHADGLRYLKTYGWHDPDGDPFCVNYDDHVPETDEEWEEVPETCECGFYDALQHLMQEDHE